MKIHPLFREFMIACEHVRRCRSPIAILFVPLLLILACVSITPGSAPAPEETLISTLSSTPSFTPSITPSATPLPTDTPSSTATPTFTPTFTPVPSATPAPLIFSEIQIPAPSLKENLIGDPDSQPVQVYLPPSYESSGNSYPVVYYLPGFGVLMNTGNVYFSPDKVAASISSGQIKEMILVVPNGSNMLDGSFYVNSPVTGNWEDFILQDVTGYIDANYRTIARADGRGISGHSMGGFSALDLAMRHPDIFSASYSLSPGMFDENGLADSQMFRDMDRMPAYIKRLEALHKMTRDEALQEMTQYEGNFGFTVAYGAAFAPDPDLGPPFFDFPFEMKNGQAKRTQKVWQRWENGFGGWPEKIAEYHDNLASLRGIVIDYGINDGLKWIPRGSEYVAKLLTEAGIPNQIYRFEGGHGDKVEERILNVMLPFFNQVLADPE
jgi:S-formylglutathione hydrolase FrmB